MPVRLAGMKRLLMVVRQWLGGSAYRAHDHD
jgi:hypothetical protein